MSNYLNKIKKIIIDNAADLILFLITAVIVLVLVLLISVYKNNKVKEYNSELFIILEDKNSVSRMERLENFYNNKKIYRLNKTLTGLKLGQEYYNKKDYKKFIEINEDILINEKNKIFSNTAGLNIISVKLNEALLDTKYLDEIFLKLENKKNPFLNLIKEKKAIYFVKQNKIIEAKKILNELLLDTNNSENFKNRIDKYLKLL